MLDFIDFQRVDTLLEGFNRSTGFVTAIVDLEGNILSKSGWRRICTQFHRLNEETNRRCVMSDTVLSNRMSEGEHYHFYTCLNGLVDVAVPIIVEGMHLANLFSGQFLFQKPDVEYFKTQSSRFGFDEQSYLDALLEVPVVSQEKVTTVMGFLSQMTQLISEMAYQKMEQMELNRVLKQNEKILRESERKYKGLFEAFPLGITVSDLDGNVLEKNSRAVELLGLEEEEGACNLLVGKRLQTIWPNRIEMPTSECPGIRALKENRRVENVEVGIENPDGSVTWLNITSTPHFHDPHHAVTMYSDISNQHKLEHEYETLFTRMLNGFALHEIVRNSSGVPVDYRFLDVNPAFEDLMGVEREQLVGVSAREFFDASWSGILDMFEKVAKTGAPMVFRHSSNLLHKHFELTAFMNDANQISCIFHDITKRKRMQDKLRKSLQRFRIAQDMSPDGFTILHPIRDQKDRVVDFTWVYENPAIARLNGTDQSKVVGKRLLDLFPSHLGTKIFKVYQQVAETGVAQTIEQGYSGESMSQPTWFRLVVVPMSEDIAILAQDLTERKHSEEMLKYQNDHDLLTGMYSRAFLEDSLKQLEDESILPISIIIFDTNGLKLVNDSFGHAEGDAVLKKTAQLLQSHCREKNIIARFGGDEFVVVLPGTTPQETESLIASIETDLEEFEFDSVQFSLAFGYATRNTMDEDFVTIFKKAEDMMYRNKLYESDSAKNKTIGLIINSLFAKSPRESEHSKRVSELCEFIAEKLQMSTMEVQRMRIAGLMHDIGKIGIPERILNKAGRLSDTEWEQILRHPEIGFRILSASNEFTDISTAILEHHERWDGKGYPRGLSGNSISLQGRIITIADAFDAMTSERSYKMPMSVQAALEEIHRCAGSHFDPDLARLFAASYEEFNTEAV